jgi:hypothetical protein
MSDASYALKQLQGIDQRRLLSGQASYLGAADRIARAIDALERIVAEEAANVPEDEQRPDPLMPERSPSGRSLP